MARGRRGLLLSMVTIVAALLVPAWLIHGTAEPVDRQVLVVDALALDGGGAGPADGLSIELARGGSGMTGGRITHIAPCDGGVVVLYADEDGDHRLIMTPTLSDAVGWARVIARDVGTPVGCDASTGHAVLVHTDRASNETWFVDVGPDTAPETLHVIAHDLPAEGPGAVIAGVGAGAGELTVDWWAMMRWSAGRGIFVANATEAGEGDGALVVVSSAGVEAELAWGGPLTLLDGSERDVSAFALVPMAWNGTHAFLALPTSTIVWQPGVGLWEDTLLPGSGTITQLAEEALVGHGVAWTATSNATGTQQPDWTGEGRLDARFLSHGVLLSLHREAQPWTYVDTWQEIGPVWHGVSLLGGFVLIAWMRALRTLRTRWRFLQTWDPEEDERFDRHLATLGIRPVDEEH